MFYPIRLEFFSVYFTLYSTFFFTVPLTSFYYISLYSIPYRIRSEVIFSIIFLCVYCLLFSFLLFKYVLFYPPLPYFVLISLHTLMSSVSFLFSLALSLYSTILGYFCNVLIQIRPSSSLVC